MDGGRVVPPQVSGMPIEVGSALICSGGAGFGVIGSFYRQSCQPRECLPDHQNAKRA